MILIHGDFPEKSYQALSKHINSSLQFNYSELDHAKLRQLVENVDLFGQQPTLVLHGLLSSPKSNKKTQLIKVLEISKQASVVLYESKKIASKDIPASLNLKIEEYKVTSELFNFLDAVRPNNYQRMNNLLDQTLVNQEIQLVFYLLLKHIKKIVCHIENPNFHTLAPFIRKKLDQQVSYFTFSSAVTFMNTLVDIDLNRKHGRSSFSLIDSLKFALLELSFK